MVFSIRSRGARTRGFTMAELLVSVAITALIMAMVLPAMVFYAGMAKSIRTDQRLQAKSVLFEEKMSMEMAQVYEVNFSSNTVITFSSHTSEFVADTSQPTGYRFVQATSTTTLVYRDEDDDPTTIRDNSLTRLVVTTDAAGEETSRTEEAILTLLSPMKDKDGKYLPIFQSVLKDDTTYVLFRARVGDHVANRKNMSNAEKALTNLDDAFTGPGYQGFVMYYVFAPRQRIAV